MSKLTLNDVSNLLGNPASAAARLNENNAALESALDNTLSRDGTSPNQMGSALDMNSQRILNLPAPVDSTEPARLTDLQGITQITGIPVPTQTAQTGKVLTTNGSETLWGGQSTIGALLYPHTQAEIDASVTPTNYAYPPGNILRYGADPTGVADSAPAFQAAMDAATYRGHVVVPPGEYKIDSTLSIPMVAFGAFDLELQAGARLIYSGNSHCIDANLVSTPYANVRIFGGGEIVGTSAGLSGIRYYCFNRGVISGIRSRGFSNGAGILIQGANCIDMLSVEVSNNRDGIRLVSKLDGVEYAANACRVIGGHVSNNSRWGIYDDATGDGGSNLNNYYAATFDPNGANGPGSGNIFIQGGTGHVIASYLEYGTLAYGQYNIALGDGTYHPVGVVIRGCVLGSAAATTAAIYDNGTGTVIDGNTEVGNPTNFILGGPDGSARRIGFNYAPSAGTYHGGTDNGDTLSIGSAASTLANSMAPSATGLAMRTICGMGAPLNIRARDAGDTFIAQFQDYGGTNMARVTTKGGLQLATPAGSFTAANTLWMGSGLPSNADGADGDHYLRTDTPGSASQRHYVKSAGVWVGIA